MSRPNTILYTFFSLFVLIAQQANPLYITQIRNDSAEPVIITYCINNQNARNVVEVKIIEIPKNTVHDIDLDLQANIGELENRLDLAEHYLKITTYSTSFLCAEGCLEDADNSDFVRYGTWLQREPKLNRSHDDKVPSIRLLNGSYGSVSLCLLDKRIIKEKPTPLNKPITLTIDVNGTIS